MVAAYFPSAQVVTICFKYAVMMLYLALKTNITLLAPGNVVIVDCGMECEDTFFAAELPSGGEE